MEGERTLDLHGGVRVRKDDEGEGGCRLGLGEREDG